MRRIIFNSDTIDALRHYLEVEQHSLKEACVHFGISYDVMKRLRYEHNIQCKNDKSLSEGKVQYNVSPEKVNHLLHLFKDTDMRIADICKELKLEDFVVQGLLREHFSEADISSRKARLYRKSKLHDKNPMHGKRGAETSNWKGGIVSDGNGYLITRKPDWYTGRARSDYIFYHSVVLCEALGLTEIPKGFVVHHIDYNPLNNDINNLALVSMGAHARLHAIEKKMMSQGSETIRKGVGTDGAETLDPDRPE